MMLFRHSYNWCQDKWEITLVLKQNLKVLCDKEINKRYLCFILLKITFYINVMVSWFMMFNATFNNIVIILWLSVLLMEETGENHWPVTSNWQTLSHNVVEYTSPWVIFELTMLEVIGTDYTGSCKSNYHIFTTTMAT